MAAFPVWLRRLESPRFLAASLSAAVLAIVVLGLSGEAILHLTANTRTLRFDVTPGPSIVWPLEGGQLADCKGLLGQGASAATNIKAGSSLEIRMPSVGQGQEAAGGLAVKTSLSRGVLVLEFLKTAEGKVLHESSDASCGREAGPQLWLEDSDGEVQRVQLPAQVKIPLSSFGDPLTLQFRGQVVLGQDVSSGDAHLLESGTLSLRWVRSSWLQALPISGQYAIESVPLSPGEKVVLGTSDADHQVAPEGFLRVQTGAAAPAQIQVFAVSPVAQVEMIKPFSAPETPQASFVRRVTRDDACLGLLSILFTIVLAWIPLAAASPHRRETGATPSSS
jgi:hypothetical protein